MTIKEHIYTTECSHKERLVALLLCIGSIIFLGAIPLHRFYVGRIGSGVLMILFYWTFIPLIISIIDLIKILMGYFVDGLGKPLLDWL